MPDATTTRRMGPLTACDDAGGLEAGSDAAVAIGDTAARHVRLSARGLTSFVGESAETFLPWAGVRAVALDASTTWWPSPRLADIIRPTVAALLGEGGDLEETPTCLVRITTVAGDDLDWAVTAHHLSGYRRRDAARATRIVAHLATHPEARALLDRPADALAQLGRLSGPAGPTEAAGGDRDVT